MRVWIFASALLIAACGDQVATAPEPRMPDSDVAEMPIRPANPDLDIEAIATEAAGSINPLENDLRGLEIAYRLHDAFQFTERRGAEFILRAEMSNGDVPIDETFTLEKTKGVESPLLSQEARDGFYIATYRLKDADKPRMAAADAKLQALKETSDGNNSLTFNAAAFTCVPVGVEAPDEYSLTIYVRSHPGVDFITLSDEWLVTKSEQTGIAELWNECDA